ncbi:MAG TPA: CorA family divalent cation transporter, partial [Solirubrobacteraceae bacterium]|nr:CorA family divalent cation transporter [Solirubrobacteraceae bacterium]
MQVLDAIDRAAIDRLRTAGEYFWLDLVDPSQDALDEMCGLFGVGELVAEDLRERGQRPKLDDYDSYVHGVFYGVDGDELVEVHFVIHGDAVITVRPARCAALAGVRARVAQVDPTREEQAIYLVLDALTDSFFPLLERMADEIDDIEDRIVSAGGRHAPALQAFAARRRR